MSKESSDYDTPKFQCEHCEKFFEPNGQMIRDTAKLIEPNILEPTATFICESCFHKMKDQS